MELSPFGSGTASRGTDVVRQALRSRSRQALAAMAKSQVETDARPSYCSQREIIFRKTSWVTSSASALFPSIRSVKPIIGPAYREKRASAPAGSPALTRPIRPASSSGTMATARKGLTPGKTIGTAEGFAAAILPLVAVSLQDPSGPDFFS